MVQLTQTLKKKVIESLGPIEVEEPSHETRGYTHHIMNKSAIQVTETSIPSLVSNLFSEAEGKINYLMMDSQQKINQANQQSSSIEGSSNPQNFAGYQEGLQQTLSMIQKFKNESNGGNSIFATLLIGEENSSQHSMPMGTTHAPTGVVSNHENIHLSIEDSNDQAPNGYSVETKNVFQYRGFVALKEFLSNLQTNHPIPSVEIRSRFIENNDVLVTGVSFCYENSPVKGWRKELMLRMNGKTRGKLDTYFQNPQRTRKFRSRADLQVYFEKERIPLGNLNKFNFQVVFCVCQSREDSSRHYLECSYGKCGCNTWIHPECVGLGYRTEEELHHMDKVICPLCSVYLDGCGRASQFENDYRMLRTLTPGFVHASTTVKTYNIEESNMPHRLWGLEGSTCCYKIPDNQMKYELSVEQAAQSQPPVEELSMSFNTATNHANNNNNSNFIAEPDDNNVSDWPTGLLPQHSLFSHVIRGQINKKEIEVAALVKKEEETIVVLHEDEGLDCWRRKVNYPLDTATAGDEEGEKKPRIFGVYGNGVKYHVTSKHQSIDATLLDEKNTLAAPSNINAAATVTDNAINEEEPNLTPQELARKVLAKASALRQQPHHHLSASAATTGFDLFDPTPSMSMKRKLLDFMMNATKVLVASRSTKKARSSIGSASATTTGMESKSTSDGFLRVPLVHLPMEDGGMKVIPISHNLIPRSLHTFCSGSSSFCGFCFQPLLPIAATTASSSDHHPSLAHLICGDVTLTIHTNCQFMIQRKQYLSTEANNNNNQRLIEIQSLYPYETEDDIATTANSVAYCLLCGKTGGCLYQFDIPPLSSSQLDCFLATKRLLENKVEEDDDNEEEDDNGGKRAGGKKAKETKDTKKKREEVRQFYGHIPCLQYLQSSQLLTLPSLQTLANNSNHNKSQKKQKETSEVIDLVEEEEEVEKEQKQEQEEEKVANSPAAVTPQEPNNVESKALFVSLFEQQCNTHRCMLCGLKIGIVLRCASIGCAVRAHPLCVLLTKSWTMTKFRYHSNSSSSSAPSTTIGFLCGVHKPSSPALITPPPIIKKATSKA